MGIGHQLKGDYEQGRRGGKGQCLSQRHSGLQRALLPFCIELHTISGLFQTIFILLLDTVYYLLEINLPRVGPRHGKQTLMELKQCGWSPHLSAPEFPNDTQLTSLKTLSSSLNPTEGLKATLHEEHLRAAISAITLSSLTILATLTTSLVVPRLLQLSFSLTLSMTL